ncbi:MAG: hypothetical protein RLZZ330_1074 [Actinomycetota bacterium]|jgi:3-methyladenine DNA glycosylase AlkD
MKSAAKPATKPFNEKDFVAGLVLELNKKANKKRAAEMSAYMRNLFPFLGVNAPERTVILRVVSAQFEKPSQAQIVKVLKTLWEKPEREFHIIGTEFLNKNKKQLDSSFVTKHAKYFITHNSWWDSVDSLRGAISYLVASDPELDEVMYQWIESENKWLVRSAIIHQLLLKGDTDPVKLFALCERRHKDTEFFIAKAVGWALRDFSYVDAEAVKRFVRLHPDMTPLAKREALKAINRKASK